MIFKTTLQKMLKLDLVLQIMNYRPLSRGKNKKCNCINERWIRWKTMTKFVVLRARTYTYSIDDGIEDKKPKGKKKVRHKKTVKFENYKKFFGSKSTW